MKNYEIRIPVTFDLKVEAESWEEAEEIVKRKLGRNGYNFDLMMANSSGLSGWLNFHNEAITDAEVWVTSSHLEDAEWYSY